MKTMYDCIGSKARNAIIISVFMADAKAVEFVASQLGEFAHCNRHRPS
jgi:hypothetical protein